LEQQQRVGLLWVVLMTAMMTALVAAMTGSQNYECLLAFEFQMTGSSLRLSQQQAWLCS
jgi:hypothetical protein